MHTEPLDVIPLWGIFAGACALTWAALVCGDRLGRWRLARAGGEKEGPVGAMVGAVMALVAFMLAFTFSLAAERFDARRRVVLEEANAIGTTYLRARLLADPERSEVRKLLREYVNIRIAARQQSSTPESVAGAVVKSEQLHEELWKQAAAAAEKAPNDITGLFIASLNQVIDLHAVRVTAGIRNRVPLVIWLTLLVLAALGLGSVGYQAGIANLKRSPAMVAMVIAFAVTIYLIADLDRPGEGMLGTSQAALMDVQRMMNSAAPAQ